MGKVVVVLVIGVVVIAIGAISIPLGIIAMVLGYELASSLTDSTGPKR